MSSGFGVGLQLFVTCNQCGAEAAMPPLGPRNPVSGDSTIIVDAETPCPQCGCTRVKLKLDCSWKAEWVIAVGKLAASL